MQYGGKMEEEIKSELEQEQLDEIETEGDEEVALIEEFELTEVETLREEIDLLQQQSNEYLDGWQRERAEFANYKKRKERESQQLRESITGNIIRKYLEVVDDLERALQNRPADDEGASWAEGIELVYRKFLTALESEGVVQMQVEGTQFDPNLHEAISQEPSEEFESGQVIEVLRKGYMLGERVLRPASVRIAQ
jgi:molecular chaperone GrpE